MYVYEDLTELDDLFATLLWRGQFLLLMTEGTEEEHALWTAYRLNEGWEERGNGVAR